MTPDNYVKNAPKEKIAGHERDISAAFGPEPWCFLRQFARQAISLSYAKWFTLSG